MLNYEVIGPLLLILKAKRVKIEKKSGAAFGYVMSFKLGHSDLITLSSTIIKSDSPL